MSRVLVTGATGYVGSRLVPALLEAGHDVVAAARDPAKLSTFPWIDDVQTVELDVLDAQSCLDALAEGIDVAYYLVHAIGEGDFATRDREAAGFFGAAAEAGGVGRIVYLGGFVPDGETLSDHLDSRAETAEVLERSGVPVVWLRAAVVVGAGSTSFEIIRYLADRLPVLPTPEWMGRLVQPIAVDDVLYYLVASASDDLPAGGYDIAGEEALPNRDVLGRYRAAAGRRRRRMPVPGGAPGVAAAVIGRLTPVPSALTADLIDSLRNTMVSGDDRIRQFVPDPPGGLTTLAESMRRALAGAAVRGDVGDGDPLSLTVTDPDWAGGDASTVSVVREVAAPAVAVWERIEGIGGARLGFLGWPAAWRTRGVGLRLATGHGLTVDQVAAGRWSVDDRLDFFRVDTVDDGHRIRFVTAPHAPGTGSLDLRVEPDGDDRCTLHIDATWAPRGSTGRVWSWSLRPLHAGAFAGLARTLARDAEGTLSTRE